MRLVEKALLRRFGDNLPKERICAEVHEVVSHIRDARVRTFIPALVEREAGENLKRQIS